VASKLLDTKTKESRPN